MDLGFHPRRVAGSSSDLLQSMLAGDRLHQGLRAQSQEGRWGTHYLIGTSYGVGSLQGIHSKGEPGGTDFSKRLPHTANSDSRENQGKSRPFSSHDKKSGAGVKRLEKTGSEAAICGRTRSCTWSLPQRFRQHGLNLEPLKGPCRKTKRDAPLPDQFTDELQTLPKRSRGSMAKALEIASSAEALGAARNALVSNFWAANTVAVKKSRREEVLRLAFKVQDSVDIFPLTKALVEGVAAALKAAGITSGALYLNELKMIHVEKGFEVEQWLQRVFVLCNKSLTRNRGPVKRAPEVKLEDLAARVWKRGGDPLLPVPLAALAYAWGVAWMLREVELSKVKWKHVTCDPKLKWIKLFIPHSKVDQQALGVTRTLKCCGGNPCWKGCPWWIFSTLKVSGLCLPADVPDAPLFPNRKGSHPSKTEMVNSWVSAFGVPIRGHSARRSGAMAYTRRGMSLQELSFLGRWRSSVVLDYANEALESVPANERLKKPKRPTLPADAPTAPQAEPILVPTPVAENPMPSLGGSSKDRWLWVKSAERGSNALHIVDNAAWDLPLDRWSAACGWFFARKSTRFSFMSEPSMAAVKCKKCLAMKRSASLCDVVKEKMVPAQAVAHGISCKLGR